MTDDTRGCLLCGGTPTTKSHILSKPLAESLPPTVGGTRVTQLLADGSTIDREYNKRTTTAYVKRLCAPCNNKWMEGFESATREKVLAMIHGQDVVIEVGDQVKIATWAAVAMMLRATTDEGVPAIPVRDHRWIREHDVPPDGWRIFAVHMDELGVELQSRHLRVDCGDITRAMGHASFIRVGHLGIVFASGGGGEPARQVTPMAMFHPAVRWIWPTPLAHEPINWPPSDSATFTDLWAMTSLRPGQ